MEIKSYKKCSNNTYEIRLDNGEKYRLYEDVIIDYELLINKNVTSTKLKKMLLQNELLEAYYKALKYIGIKMRTEKEIDIYLKKSGYSENSIEYAKNKLKDDGYLNEDKYAQAYILDAINLSNVGPKRIAKDLNNLGIKANIISKYLTYNREFWLDRIKAYIEKYAKKNKSSALVFKNKIYKQLMLLGYESDDINFILDDFIIDTSSAFENDAKKAWRHLEKEMDYDKRVWKFKNKLYSKGYSQDEINSYIEKELN